MTTETAALPSANELQDELRTLRSGCGLADQSHLGRLEITGPDRLRFANAYLTCDVKGMAADTGVYGFFTTPQGRILTDVAVLALEDRLWLRVGEGREEAMAAHLQKYVLSDRVEIRTLPDVRCLTLVGPGSREVLSGTAESLAEPWRHVHATIAGAEALVVRTGRLGAEAYTLWLAAAEAERLRDRLLEDGAVRPVGPEALEALRIEAGIPRYGRDFGEENFPQETGIEEAVSYTKGCYLGQEIVARIHYRGGVQKTLCGLHFDGDATAGAQLSLDDRQAGVATSVVVSPTLGRRIGLAILHKRAAEPGTRLIVEGGMSVEVVPLPFVP